MTLATQFRAVKAVIQDLIQLSDRGATASTYEEKVSLLAQIRSKLGEVPALPDPLFIGVEDFEEESTTDES